VTLKSLIEIDPRDSAWNGTMRLEQEVKRPRAVAVTRSFFMELFYAVKS
jgi:hypothetical protein